MAKQVECKHCGQPIAASAKRCPYCGGRNKQPIYKKWWFWLIIGLVILAFACGGADDKAAEKSETAQTASEETERQFSEPAERESDQTAEATEETESEESSIEEASSESDEELRPEFKEAMDSYETFYNEYCDLMEEYKDNPTNMELISKYNSMLIKAVEMDEKFEAWDEEEMNHAELKYYIEVTNRIELRLLDVAE